MVLMFAQEDIASRATFKNKMKALGVIGGALVGN